MSKQAPYWTKVIKYKKNTQIVEKEYPVTKFKTAKDSVNRVKDLQNYLYVYFPKAYEHEEYDWVIYCDKYTQMILDQMESL